MPPDHAPQDTLHAVCSSRREQPYRMIHKGLRMLLAQAQHLAGACDVRQADERATLVEAVEQALSVCADHLAHENRFFHEPLRQRAPRAVLAFDNDHQEHLLAIDALRLQLQRVRDAGADAESLAYALYLRFSQFVADNLQHMAEEETVLTPALWAHFTDAEIRALTDALRASLSPHENLFYLRWMARGLNAAELGTLLAGARAQATSEVFEPLCGVVLDELPEPRRGRLVQALGLAGLGLASLRVAEGDRP